MLSRTFIRALLAAVLALTWMSSSHASLLTFDYSVAIESGSRTGQLFGGSFSVDTSSLSGTGLENVTTSTFSFDYPDSFLGAITAQFSDGIFSKIIGQNGPGTGRYGFNSGFTSFQVSSGCQNISCSADNYFGYLDSQTFVDGFGAVSYEQRVPEPAIIALFGLGLVGVGFARRRIRT